MIKKRLSSISIYQFEILQKYTQIFHFVTNRHGGESKGSCSSLNLSFKVEDEEKNINTNRSILAQNLGIDESNFFYPDQCHTSNIKIIDKSTNQSELKETDALITDLPGKVICITTADCVPILLYAPDKNICAAVHAGWRGLISLLPLKTIEIIVETYYVNPSQIIACVGPCISVSNYEVGNEVIRAVKQFGNYRGLIHPHVLKEKGYLDLVELTRRQLNIAGIENKNIEVSGICTFESSSEFYTARKEGFNTGRFVSAIMIKKLL